MLGGMITETPVTGVKVDERPHPPGKKGAMLSLQEVADRAWKGRMSKRLREWVTQQLDKCGVSRGSRREKAQCLLDAYRKKVPYIADPVMGEFMAKPEQTLCLDEGGLCIVGGDCDDASLTLAACMMCIGINAMIVGSSHREPLDVPTHVFMAFEDELGDWVRMDGTAKLPVGQAPSRMREFWVEPGKKQKENMQGDFVGMSGAGDLGAPASRLDLLYPGIR